MQKPLPGEYNPNFQQYIDLIGEGDFFDLFKQNISQAKTFFQNIPVEKHNFRYAAG